MAAEFEETEDMFPRIPRIALVGTMAAMDVAILVCIVADVGMDWWELAVMVVLTVAVALLAHLAKVHIRIEDGKIYAGIFRIYSWPLDHVIDVKTGDIDVMRNYSGWGIKKVRFKTFAAPGTETAVSVKLTGRAVLTVTTEDPEKLAGILLANRREA